MLCAYMHYIKESVLGEVMNEVSVQLVGGGAEAVPGGHDVLIFLGQTLKLPSGYTLFERASAKSPIVAVNPAVDFLTPIKADWKYLGCAGQFKVRGIIINFRAFAPEECYETAADLPWKPTHLQPDLSITVCEGDTVGDSEVIFSSRPNDRWQSCTQSFGESKVVTLRREPCEICAVC